MKWELDALKRLATVQTVPGVALGDAVGEIEKLTKQNKTSNDPLGFGSLGFRV